MECMKNNVYVVGGISWGVGLCNGVESSEYMNEWEGFACYDSKRKVRQPLSNHG